MVIIRDIRNGYLVEIDSGYRTGMEPQLDMCSLCVHVKSNIILFDHLPKFESDLMTYNLQRYFIGALPNIRLFSHCVGEGGSCGSTWNSPQSYR